MHCVLCALDTTEKRRAGGGGVVYVGGHWFSLGLELPERSHTKDYGETLLPPFCSRCRQVGSPVNTFEALPPPLQLPSRTVSEALSPHQGSLCAVGGG